MRAEGQRDRGVSPDCLRFPLAHPACGPGPLCCPYYPSFLRPFWSQCARAAVPRCGVGLFFKAEQSDPMRSSLGRMREPCGKDGPEEAALFQRPFFNGPFRKGQDQTGGSMLSRGLCAPRLLVKPQGRLCDECSKRGWGNRLSRVPNVAGVRVRVSLEPVLPKKKSPPKQSELPFHSEASERLGNTSTRKGPCRRRSGEAVGRGAVSKGALCAARPKGPLPDAKGPLSFLLSSRFRASGRPASMHVGGVEGPLHGPFSGPLFTALFRAPLHGPDGDAGWFQMVPCRPHQRARRAVPCGPRGMRRSRKPPSWALTAWALTGRSRKTVQRRSEQGPSKLKSHEEEGSFSRMQTAPPVEHGPVWSKRGHLWRWIRGPLHLGRWIRTMDSYDELLKRRWAPKWS
mmetsp:Transcript_25097/g.86646  ORF Transcript_25097/g.86646 Transcript_25097/m.86646 type:complete len:400 (+) Transcript_25097:713-1912(+)